VYGHDACSIELWVNRSMNCAYSRVVSSYIHHRTFTSDSAFEEDNLATLNDIFSIAFHITAHVKVEVSLLFDLHIVISIHTHKHICLSGKKVAWLLSSISNWGFLDLRVIYCRYIHQ